MNCNIAQANLVAYLHGELEKKIVMGIHHHLSACEACVQEEIELRQTIRLLDQYQFEALPEDFDEKLYHKIQQTQLTPKTKKTDFRRIVYAVAATIIIMIGIQFFGARIFESIHPPGYFKDFTSKQAVFKSEAASAEPSLKERFFQRYFQTRQGKLLGKSVIR